MFGFIWSLMLETLQLILRVGSFDVDDMFLNTLGAGIGFYIHGIAHYVRVSSITGGGSVETGGK